MRYRPFGRTGLQVSVVGFGCWPMAGDRYGAIEDDEAVKAIHRALDRGVNCVDTAPAYGAGHSEEVVARALDKRRGEVLLVTKCGVKVPPPGQPGPLRDSSRANVLREIDASLKRLRTDWVDVLLVHWPDAGTPFEETMRALEDVVASGRARFVGVSNFTGAMITECMRTRRIDVSQVGYHMFDRRQEQETFGTCLTTASASWAMAPSVTACSPAPSPRRRRSTPPTTGAPTAWHSVSRSSARTISRRTSAWSSGSAARSPRRAARP
ncbi:MAG: hypothetical protein AUI04_16650 [Candidatus Rokubacteria bacterium 13_2_20CM_2_64_8]|nr:MAG: hypothetical protein AUI04_16650 [Candidatus Rokubacteria bacterium 13_2_20CM_2_64_8]